MESKRSKRRLKRPLRRNVKEEEDSKVPKTSKKVPLRHLKRYVKKTCDYIYPDGRRCKAKAVGKGSLCKKHGGSPVIKENLIPIDLEVVLKSDNSSYDPAVHPMQFIELSKAGMSRVEIAAEMGVSISAINSWTEKFESFYLATEVGSALHETWWIQQGKGGLHTRNFNTPLFKFLTSNKLGYSDKMETKSTNLTVHGVLVAPDVVSEDEWESEI